MTTATIEAYDELLRSFAAHIGLDAEELARTQEIVIDELRIGLAYEGLDGFGELAYFVDLGAPPAHLASAVYRVLLEANHMWAGTGGATLGLQQDTGNIVLAGRIDFSEMTAEGLGALLDAFADTALFWKKFIDGEIDQPDTEPAPFALRA